MTDPVIMVSGWVDFSAPEDRNKYIELSMERMNVAQASEGCEYYVLVADPTKPERVRVFEKFTNAAAFEQHIKDVQEGRAPGPPQGLDVKGREILIFEANLRPTS